MGDQLDDRPPRRFRVAVRVARARLDSDGRRRRRHELASCRDESVDGRVDVVDVHAKMLKAKVTGRAGDC